MHEPASYARGPTKPHFARWAALSRLIGSGRAKATERQAHAGVQLDRGGDRIFQSQLAVPACRAEVGALLRDGPPGKRREPRASILCGAGTWADLASFEGKKTWLSRRTENLQKRHVPVVAMVFFAKGACTRPIGQARGRQVRRSAPCPVISPRSPAFVCAAGLPCRASQALEWWLSKNVARSPNHELQRATKG